MRIVRLTTSLLLGTAGACAFFIGSALAADTSLALAPDDTTLPAVSGVNGKWEFNPGILSNPGGYGIGGAGSLSLPLGDRFGAQADIMGEWTAGGMVYGGALHLFTRDPSLYLAGVTAGVVVAPGANIQALGVEGELYVDRMSLEGWAGLASVNYTDPMVTDETGLFAFGDVAYYPSDDLRLALGGSIVLDQYAAHASAEYLLREHGLPMSVVADARLYTSGDYRLSIGLQGYFGGDDPDKSLIDRHRQDDPRNRAVDLFAGSNNLLFETAEEEEPDLSDPEASEEACDYWEGDWVEGDPGWCDINND